MLRLALDCEQGPLFSRHDLENQPVEDDYKQDEDYCEDDSSGYVAAQSQVETLKKRKKRGVYLRLALVTRRLFRLRTASVVQPRLPLGNHRRLGWSIVRSGTLRAGSGQWWLCCHCCCLQGPRGVLPI